MHVHNERDIPQAKLASEINARILLNEHGNLYFLLFLFHLRKFKKNYRKETKRYRWKCAQNRYSGMQIMTAKTATIRTLYVHVLLNGVIVPEILYDIVSHARHFRPVKCFPKC